MAHVYSEKSFSVATHSNLGVIFDSDLHFDNQITKVVQSCLMEMRNLAMVKNFVCQDDLEAIVHDFMLSRLHYCNSLYSGLKL